MPSPKPSPSENDPPENDPPALLNKAIEILRNPQMSSADWGILERIVLPLAEDEHRRHHERFLKSSDAEHGHNAIPFIRLYSSLMLKVREESLALAETALKEIT